MRFCSKGCLCVLVAEDFGEFDERARAFEASFGPQGKHAVPPRGAEHPHKRPSIPTKDLRFAKAIRAGGRGCRSGGTGGWSGRR
jgi:hypothetical protein